MIVIWGCFLL